MILTVNIGNTHITIAGYEHDALQFSGRLHSDAAATIDEYAMDLLNLLSLYRVQTERIEGGILGSVVPALTGRVLAALRMLCSARFLTVDNEVVRLCASLVGRGYAKFKIFVHGRGKRMVYRHEAVFFFRPFEHREFGYPQNIVGVFVYEIEFVGKHKAKSAERVEHYVVFIRREEQRVALFEVHTRFDIGNVFFG